MDIQTFRARTLQEALQRVRDTMGPDAAIVHTREVQNARLGLFAQRSVEVDACLDPNRAGQSAPQASAHASDSRERSQASDSRMAANGSLSASSLSVSPTNTLGNCTPAMRAALDGMCSGGMSTNEAEALLSQACETLDASHRDELHRVQAAIAQVLAGELCTCSQAEDNLPPPRLIALIGPTGEGKTTSLAKLSAGVHVEQPLQIGLISLDSCRHGAVDQLLQHAELLGASLEVVSGPGQIPAALHRLQDCELVYLDTAGRSPNDAQQLSILGDALAAAQPDAVHLVLSATSSRAHIMRTLEMFSPLHPTSLLITKLDQCSSLGEWLPILRQAQLPISYLTAGQRVPQDILVATPQDLAQLLLGQGLRSSLANGYADSVKKFLLSKKD